MSSYPELTFVLRLTNAFSSSESVRFHGTEERNVAKNVVLECHLAFRNGGS